MTPMKRYILAGLIVLLTIGLGACADSNDNQPDGDMDDDTPTESDLDPSESDSPELDVVEMDDEIDGDGEAEEEEEAPPVIAFSITASSHCVQVDDTASPSEQTAAEELRSTLEEIFGVAQLFCDDAAAQDRAKIVVGMGASAEALGADPDPEALGEQGHLIRTIPPDLVIAGTAGAGTMYGVHRFLERIAGVRWLAPGVTQIPTLSEIPVPENDRIVTPAFLWRDTYYTWPGGDDAFQAHMADNAGGHGSDDPYGLEYAFDGTCHTYFRFISPGEYFDEHPEYFSEIGGVRVRDETQLCLTNPDVLDIVTEKMLARMADNPNVRQHNFSQMDHYNYCECDACRAKNEQYGTSGGTQFWFINELAKRTAEVYPDKLVGTLAYMYTEEPPVGLTMHPNAAVWLCHMYPSCDSHPIESCPLNADYKRRALAWADLTEHLYVWHYITDFTHYYVPFPNFDAMSADMRFYRDIGVEGIFLQGMGQGGGGGEWSLLRPYYGAHLLWNPDRNPQALRREFLEGYYGAAAEPLERYIELLQAKVRDDDIHMHLYTNPAQGYLPDDIVSQAEAAFDEAESLVADDEEILERVRVARMPLTYTKMFPHNGNDIVDERIHWLSEIADWGEVQDFFERMEAHGFQIVREQAGDRASMELLYLLMSGDPQVYTIENSKLAIEIVPNLGARALRITHKASGECITAWNVKQGLFYPFNGGLEDRIGGIIPFGWVEPGAIVAQEDTLFGTQQNTMNGFKVRREIALDGNEAAFTVRTTVTNPSDGPLLCQLREHVEYDLGSVQSTRVAFTARSGASVDQDMSAVIAGMREGVHYYDQDVPLNEWKLRGDKGLEVVESFDDAQVDYTWIYAFPESLNEVECEVAVKPQTLEAGESIIFERRFEINSLDD